MPRLDDPRALYDRRPDGTVARRRGFEIDLDPAVDGGRTEVAELAGEPVADLLLVNDGDLTYAKVRLADSTIAALPDLLPAVADPLARTLLWSAAWDATRGAEARRHTREEIPFHVGRRRPLADVVADLP